ncbi:MAG: anaerobic ribonucleoside-triphosphate reductase activating protein [Porticoccaceae bacterium]
MQIGGLQKLTLLDFPERVACTIFTNGCNFRCPYCHNAELLHIANPSLISTTDVMDFLKTRQGLLDGVCITGGEPLLQPDIVECIEEIKALGFAVKLDTNGSFPEKLAALLESGQLDYVAMDIKNTPERYAETIGLPNAPVAAVRQSVEVLRASAVPHEFRTTVVREYHTEDDMRAIGRWLHGTPRYYLQRFEAGPHVLRQGLSAPSAGEMRCFLAIVQADIPAAALRGV